MMNDPVFMTAAISALIVAAVLIFGIATFAKGGEFNKRNGNKMMRLRIAAQFLAIVVVFGVLWFRS